MKRMSVLLGSLLALSVGTMALADTTPAAATQAKVQKENRKVEKAQSAARKDQKAGDAVAKDRSNEQIKLKQDEKQGNKAAVAADKAAVKADSAKIKQDQNAVKTEHKDIKMDHKVDRSDKKSEAPAASTH